jgi:hypothetical protein
MTAKNQTSANRRMPAALRDLPVFLATDLKAVYGANIGDSFGDADELCLDDTYTLAIGAKRQKITVNDKASGPFIVDTDSLIGTSGNHVHLDCAVTFMSQGGDTVEALVLAEVDPSENGLIAIYLLPLAEMVRQKEYRLMSIDREAARTRLAEVACVSFMRGTNITLGDGNQMPVEALRAGDRVLTRDNGPQTVRWIGSHTTRAIGEFATIVIKEGVLNNENDLHLSQNHRLFIYQRRDELQIGRAEILVRAGDLVDGETVLRVEGGFVDHFQILFEQHQIIYAEGIAAESLPFSRRTTAVLPPELAERFAQEIVGHTNQPHRDIEVTRATLPEKNAAEQLRRSSIG